MKVIEKANLTPPKKKFAYALYHAYANAGHSFGMGEHQFNILNWDDCCKKLVKVYYAAPIPDDDTSTYEFAKQIVEDLRDKATNYKPEDDFKIYWKMKQDGLTTVPDADTLMSDCKKRARVFCEYADIARKVFCDFDFANC